MGYKLTTVYIVTEWRNTDRGKEKLREAECDTKDEAETTLIDMSESLISNEIDGYYLDSEHKISDYRWKIRKERKLIYD